MDNEDSTIPYVIDKIPNSLSGHQILTQAQKNVWSIYINVEETISGQGAIDELQYHQTQCGKYKINISLCRMKIY